MIYKFKNNYYILTKDCKQIIKEFRTEQGALNYIKKNTKVIKFKNMYYIVDNKCNKILGKFSTINKAKQRLRQIEYFKHN